MILERRPLVGVSVKQGRQSAYHLQVDGVERVNDDGILCKCKSIVS